MNTVLLLIFLMSMSLNCAEAVGADWKYIGGSTLLQGEKTIGYFENESVEYLSGGNVKVWIKAVDQSDIKMVIKNNNKKIIEKAALKVVKGYFPPFVLVSPKTNYDDYLDIIGWEEAVNKYEINERLKILYELSCKEKKIRTLSVIYYKQNGAVEASSENLGAWNYISPESTGETLYKIFCKNMK